jgi:hypothetical protein
LSLGFVKSKSRQKRDESVTKLSAPPLRRAGFR